MTENKKTDTIDTNQTKTTETNAEIYGKLIQQMKKSKEKIAKDIDSPEFSELIVNNMTELLALRAIREQKKKAKIVATQKLMNNFKKVL